MHFITISETSCSDRNTPILLIEIQHDLNQFTVVGNRLGKPLHLKSKYTTIPNRPRALRRSSDSTRRSSNSGALRSGSDSALPSHRLKDIDQVLAATHFLRVSSAGSVAIRLVLRLLPVDKAAAPALVALLHTGEEGGPTGRSYPTLVLTVLDQQRLGVVAG